MTSHFEFLKADDFVKEFPGDRSDELQESVIFIHEPKFDAKEAPKEPLKKEVRND